VKIALAPLGPGDLGRVAHIRVAPDQEAWSGTVAQAFDDDPARVDLHVIEADGVPVGLFKIDRDYRRSVPIATPGALGLRAFLIDRDRQGRGIATDALRALPDYLARHYPKAPAVELTVNHANGAAIACYLKGGFTDTGQDWGGGRAGPQDLLHLPLPPARRMGLWADLGAWRMRAKRFLVRVRQKVPPGLRLVLGLLLILGGVLAILPVFGLWMLPLGIAVAALDVVPLWRKLRGHDRGGRSKR